MASTTSIAKILISFDNLHMISFYRPHPPHHRHCIIAERQQKTLSGLGSSAIRFPDTCPSRRSRIVSSTQLQASTATHRVDRWLSEKEVCGRRVSHVLPRLLSDRHAVFIVSQTVIVLIWCNSYLSETPRSTEQHNRLLIIIFGISSAALDK